MEQLLDNKTLAAVIAASPNLPTIRTRAVIVLNAMKHHMQKEAVQDQWHLNGYFSAITKEISDVILQDNPQVEFSPNLVGYILRQLGLQGTRTRDGYQYNWTGKQFEILSVALMETEATA